VGGQIDEKVMFIVGNPQLTEKYGAAVGKTGREVRASIKWSTVLVNHFIGEFGDQILDYRGFRVYRGQDFFCPVSVGPTQ